MPFSFIPFSVITKVHTKCNYLFILIGISWNFIIVLKVKKRMNEKQQQRYRSNRLILTNTNNNTVAKIARRYERELPNWIEHSREAAISRSYVQRESHCFANVSWDDEHEENHLLEAFFISSSFLFLFCMTLLYVDFE